MSSENGKTLPPGEIFRIHTKKMKKILKKCPKRPQKGEHIQFIRGCIPIIEIDKQKTSEGLALWLALIKKKQGETDGNRLAHKNHGGRKEDETMTKNKGHPTEKLYIVALRTGVWIEIEVNKSKMTRDVALRTGGED